MPTTPPSITALPAPPDPNDRSTFNTRAYPWSVAQQTFATEVAAVAANVFDNATEAAAAAIATAADLEQTGLDKVATAADRVQTGLDRTQTGLDKVATAADRVQTGLDAITATTQATQAAASAAAASAIVLGVSTGLPALRPTLLLDFGNSQHVDSRITFTRASAAPRVNERGLIETVASGVPRIDFDPVTGACNGLLIEEARTNLLLNSLIDGTNLTTQTVTVAAAAHTLSFYGSGSVVLSGTHSATVTGTGAYPSRKTLTFTPTAGSLTLTVTGDVKWAQLEVGAFPTSYIPTAASAVTRAADVAVMTGTNFSSWYRQDEGTFVVESATNSTNGATSSTVLSAFASSSNYQRVRHLAGLVDIYAVSGGTLVVDSDGVAVSVGTFGKTAMAYKSDDYVQYTNGVSGGADTSAALPVGVTTLNIGSTDGAGNFLNGRIRRIAYYPKRLSNSELQALTA